MKSSTLVLSIFGFCVFYICNADWMDELYERLVEDYLGGDYEEVAPFISSVTAGAEEFDRIIEELTKLKRKWYQTSVVLYFSLTFLVFITLLYQTFYISNGHSLIKTCREYLSCFNQSLNYKKKNEKIQNSATELPENKLVQTSTKVPGVNDEVPVKLLWKGGNLMESSMNCNVRNESAESKILHMQKHLLQSKLLLKCNDVGRGDDKSQISPTSSDESTAIKMAEIRKLLESEQEIVQTFIDKEDAANETRKKEIGEMRAEETENTGKTASPSVTSFRRISCRRSGQLSTFENGIDEEDQIMVDETESEVAADGNFETEKNKSRYSEPEREGALDPKLMNRIRLLESRLRIEELKNKNWIYRMSRAEGILQQLNKQVERIEEIRPMETRTETLKITSTVTNWASSVHPRRNTQFTLVNQYQPFYLDPPSMSLSEVIKKEIGFPSVVGHQGKPIYPLAPTPNIPSPCTMNIMSQSSILSKFLSR